MTYFTFPAHRSRLGFGFIREVGDDGNHHPASTRGSRPAARSAGEQFVTEDLQGLVTADLRYDCGCQSHREEFHDGSVHHLIVNHHGKVLVDEEFRGE